MKNTFAHYIFLCYITDLYIFFKQRFGETNYPQIDKTLFFKILARVFQKLTNPLLKMY
jgi:hypothetical protein